jgi:hypothetical protein
MNYSPLEQLHLTAGVGFTTAKSGYVSPNNEGEFSMLELRETSYEFRAKYEVIKDLDLGFKAEYRQFNDLLENPDNPEIQDGSAQLYLVTLNKRW